MVIAVPDQLRALLVDVIDLSGAGVVEREVPYRRDLSGRIGDDSLAALAGEPIAG